MGAFLLGLAPHLGLGKLDYPHLLGSCIWGWVGFGFPADGLLILLGWVVFFLGGVIWALVYACYVYPRLPFPGWLQGLIYGVGVFLVTSLILFPLLSEVHPLVRSGQMEAPGAFGIGLAGHGIVLANLFAHSLFGLFLGVVYQRRLVFF